MPLWRELFSCFVGEFVSEIARRAIFARERSGNVSGAEAGGAQRASTHAQLVLGNRLWSTSFEHDDDLPAGWRALVIRRELCHRSAPDLFELFRQLPGHTCAPLPATPSLQLGERRRDAVRRLVQYGCVREAAE